MWSLALRTGGTSSTRPANGGVTILRLERVAKLDEGEQRAVRAALEERAAEFATGDGYEIPGLSINVVAY